MPLPGGIGASFRVPAPAVVALAAAVATYVPHRRRRAASCDTTTGPVGLGLPAVGPARDTERTR